MTGLSGSDFDNCPTNINLTIAENAPMKIVITSKGTTLDDEVDPRFGRCQNFILIDTENDSATLIGNEENRNAAGGAGVQSAETVARSGAEYLLTGHCGPKAFQVLNAAGISIITGVEGTGNQALDSFKKGLYTATTAPDVNSHW